MRFSKASILAISTLVSANDVVGWADEFSTIAPTDTAAFTSWRNGFEDAYKSWTGVYETETGVYETETGVYETETEAFETENGVYETASYSKVHSSSDSSSKSTHLVPSYVSGISTGIVLHSPVKFAAAASATGFSTSVTGSRSARASASSRSSSSVHSSSHSSSGMGGHQAPMLVGAALVGISVLVF
ncbi:hypothetical protein JCM33374_g4658 [Metschnikowia sp. JCM 33374]|nr:hypothetical protein JCM33374_g4658 [Metschnikowia sp. JCM 33374]